MGGKHKGAKTAAGQEKAKVFCICGGEIKNVTAYENGKIKHFSRCVKCGARERLLSTFIMKAILK